MQDYVDPFRTTLICIDDYTNKCISGSIHPPTSDQGILFRSTIEMLLEIESLLEDTPQPFTAKRSFSNMAEVLKQSAAAVTTKKGKVATFSLKILFRQNASWQGSVLWHEGKTEENFRSVWELLLLLNSALSSANA